jgi:hypothetical protein
MTYASPRDQAVDDAAVAAFTESYGERATSLPPVAIVIAAYNEAGSIGPVIEELPAEVCGLATAVIVVADGCADGTAKEAMTAGALVADVPVNRGQGAALRLGYRLARDGGAAYIVTTAAWAARRPMTSSDGRASCSSPARSPCSPGRRSATRRSGCGPCGPRSPARSGWSSRSTRPPSC